MLVRTLISSKRHHCCRGLQPDRRRPPERDNRGRHASRRAAAAVAVHRRQISRHAAEHAFDLEQLAAGAGGRKDWTVPRAIDAGDSRHDPGLFLGVRVLLAVDANVAKIIAGLVLMGVGGVTLLAPTLQLQSRLVFPAGITFGFFGGFWEASQRCRDRLFSSFCSQRDCGKGFHKGSIAVSRDFRRLAGNFSDSQPPVQLA